MTLFLTIFSGVTVFVLGQITLKLLIDPIQEFKKTIADISHALIEHAAIYSNPGVAGNEVEKKVSEIFRNLSSRLNAQMYLIPKYDCISKVFGLPPCNKVAEATGFLIGLSNSVFQSASNFAIKNVEKSEKICNALGIFVPDNERVMRKESNDTKT